MFKRKSLVLLLAVSMLLISLSGMAAADEGKMEIVFTIGSSVMTVDGAQAEVDPGFDTTPVLEQGRTFLPIRTLVETLGGTIDYEAASKTVTISLDKQIIKLVLGNTAATVNGQEQTLDVAPFVSESGRTMLPLRFISENLNCQVEWVPVTQQIIVTRVIVPEEEEAAAPEEEEPAAPEEEEGPGTVEEGETGDTEGEEDPGTVEEGEPGDAEGEEEAAAPEGDEEPGAAEGDGESGSE